MRSKGISSRGFKRLAHLVQAQAWGGDTLVVSATKDYLSPAGTQEAQVGTMLEFSDGAKGYWSTGGGDFTVVTPEGETLTAQANEANPEVLNFGSDSFQLYWAASDEYMTSAPHGVMTADEQTELNSVLGTNFEVIEWDDATVQSWVSSMENMSVGF